MFFSPSGFWQPLPPLIPSGLGMVTVLPVVLNQGDFFPHEERVQYLETFWTVTTGRVANSI